MTVSVPGWRGEGLAAVFETKTTKIFCKQVCHPIPPTDAKLSKRLNLISSAIG